MVVTTADNTTNDGGDDYSTQDGDTDLEPVARAFLHGYRCDVSRCRVVRVARAVWSVISVGVPRGHSTAMPASRLVKKNEGETVVGGRRAEP